MNLEECYPRLAVWVRGNNFVAPGVVTRLHDTKLSDDVPGAGAFVSIEGDHPYEEMYVYPSELFPRNPNNLDEVPPEPLDPLGLSNFGAW